MTGDQHDTSQQATSQHEAYVQHWLDALDCRTREHANARLARLIGQTDQWRWDLLELSKQVAGCPEHGLRDHARKVATESDALYWHLTIASAALRNGS